MSFPPYSHFEDQPRLAREAEAGPKQVGPLYSQLLDITLNNPNTRVLHCDEATQYTGDLPGIAPRQIVGRERLILNGVTTAVFADKDRRPQPLPINYPSPRKTYAAVAFNMQSLSEQFDGQLTIVSQLESDQPERMLIDVEHKAPPLSRGVDHNLFKFAESIGLEGIINTSILEKRRHPNEPHDWVRRIISPVSICVAVKKALQEASLDH